MKHAEQKIIEVKVIFNKDYNQYVLDKVNIYTVVYENKTYLYAKTNGTDELTAYHKERHYWRSVIPVVDFINREFKTSDVNTTNFVLVDRTNIDVANEFIDRFKIVEDKKITLKRNIHNAKRQLAGRVQTKKFWEERLKESEARIAESTTSVNEMEAIIEDLENKLKKLEAKEIM